MTNTHSTTDSESVRQSFGYLFRAELEALKELAQSLPADPVVINIGAGSGTSALAFLESRSDIRLYSIDKQKESSPFGCLEGEKQVANKAGFGNHPHYHQIHGDSKAVGKDWIGPAVDMVFIDGDHSYAGCSGDIFHWTPHIKDNGILIVHDYDKARVFARKAKEGANDGGPHPAILVGVNMAVGRHLLDRYEVVLVADTLIAFRITKLSDWRNLMTTVEPITYSKMLSERDPPLCCVAGMQRSGTTWLNRMLADAFNVPSLTRDYTWDYPEAAKRDPVVYGLDRPGKGIRRGHWTAWQYPYLDSPVVVIVRDIRDQAVSSYHYHQQEDMDAHAKWVCGTNGEHWRKYVFGWVFYGAPIVRYEDLHGSTYHVLKDVIQQLGLDLPDDDHLKQVVKEHTFSRMIRGDKKHKQMRRGKVGDWKKEMGPKTAAHLEYVCKDVMEFLQYD